MDGELILNMTRMHLLLLSSDGFIFIDLRSLEDENVTSRLTELRRLHPDSVESSPLLHETRINERADFKGSSGLERLHVRASVEEERVPHRCLSLYVSSLSL